MLAQTSRARNRIAFVPKILNASRCRCMKFRLSLDAWFDNVVVRALDK